MLNFLRFAGLVLTLAAPLPAAAQNVPAPAPEAPVVAAPAPPAVAAPAAVSASPVAAPFKVDKPTADDLRFDRPDYVEDTEGLLGSLVRMVLVLGLVLALVYVTLNWGLRKLLRISPVRNAIVKVHERVPLDAKKTIYLVEAGDEFLLLGVGESEVSCLTRLDAERMRAALAKRSEAASAPVLSGKPFWERLLVKPPPKDPGAQGGPAPT